MQIDREQFAQELKLREQIRKAIKIVQEKRSKAQKEEKLQEVKLRKFIRQLISETTVGGSEPERSTGINELERVLKEIIKILEQDYKRLTTSAAQRQSYRAHIVKGAQNLLAPERATEPENQGSMNLAEPLEEVDIEVGDDEDEAFIDVRGGEAPKKETDPEDDFGIEGEDKTGRNYAYQSFKKIENQIMKGYEMLDSPEDKDLFYDYLITNLKLYFDKFEDELQASITPEPTTPEYEKEKASQAGDEDLGLTEESDDDIFDLGN